MFYREDDVADDIAQLSLKEGGASLENGVNGNKQQQKKVFECF